MSFDGVGRSGVGTLKVDGKDGRDKTMAKTLPMILQWDESFDIGSDTLTGVTTPITDRRYVLRVHSTS